MKKLTCLEKQERLQGRKKKTEQTFVAGLQLPGPINYALTVYF